MDADRIRGVYPAVGTKFRSNFGAQMCRDVKRKADVRSTLSAEAIRKPVV